MSDQVLARAIVEVGAQGVTDTKAKIATLEGTLNTLKAAYAAGTKGIADYLQESQALQSQIDQLTRGVKVAEAAIKKYGSAQAAATAMAKQAAQQPHGGAMNGAMGLMMLSQTLDDVQYGKGCRLAA